jgi:hypothetical protein
MSSARATGHVLGVHRCSYIDWPKANGILKQGLVRQDNSPYEAHRRMLAKGLGAAQEPCRRDWSR